MFVTGHRVRDSAGSRGGVVCFAPKITADRVGANNRSCAGNIVVQEHVVPYCCVNDVAGIAIIVADEIAVDFSSRREATTWRGTAVSAMGDMNVPVYRGHETAGIRKELHKNAVVRVYAPCNRPAIDGQAGRLEDEYTAIDRDISKRTARSFRDEYVTERSELNAY